MRILLDTHIFLWLVSGDKQLSNNVHDAIVDPNNEVYLSVVSIWESIIKYDLGRLPLPDDPATYIPKQRKLHLIETLPITESSLERLTSLPKIHKDPFDRLLVSQALAENLMLATADSNIAKYGVKILN